jgi:antitoxin component of MazEF toxin-antitoxin module
MNYDCNKQIRRIQKIGDSYFIGLPRRWVRKTHLTKGTELILDADVETETVTIRKRTKTETEKVNQ